MKSRLGLLLVGLMCITLLAIATPTQAADNRSWNWTRWDVTINTFDFKKNSFHVIETHVITVTQGSFAGGDRSVALGRLVDVSNVVVRDGPTILRYNSAAGNADSCGLTPGIYCVFNTADGERDIYYNFLARTYAGQTRTMTLEYDVIGALRSYPEGDQFWWSPLAGSRDYTVLASRVTVIMPSDTKFLEDTNTSSNWSKSVSGSTVTFVAKGAIGGSDLAEISITYRHNSTMPAPVWQAGFDAMVARRPLISVFMLVATGLIAIGGTVLIYLRYATHGRDPRPIVVPEYLTEPPSSEPPGVIGTLLDEKADMQDIMCTLLDLARRGYVVIEQIQKTGLFSHGYEFIFHRTDPTQVATTNEPPQLLRDYEISFLNSFFRGGSVIKLSDLKNKFYRYIPGLKSQLYKEVVKAGYFSQSPEQVRNSWGCLGIAMGIFGGALLFILLTKTGANLREISPLIPLPFGGLAFLGLVALVAGNYMPSKTIIGSQEAAKWKAFRNYLKNIQKYTMLANATDQFERYIGYAIAFGLEKQWMHEFGPHLVAMPRWYYIDGYGQRWSHYPSHNHMGGLSGGGNLSDLNAMSGNLTQGLNAMSSGLTSLLNSASSILSSSPSSSGGGGHGGGGGSSGGGHAGGH